MDSDDLANDVAYKLHSGNLRASVWSHLDSFIENELFVDCSLACDDADGTQVSAHRVILSAWSPVLASIFKKHKDKHPVIILRDTSFFDITALIEYMYKGTVKLSPSRLTSFLRVAQSLKVNGLHGQLLNFQYDDIDQFNTQNSSDEAIIENVYDDKLVGELVDESDETTTDDTKTSLPMIKLENLENIEILPDDTAKEDLTGKMIPNYEIIVVNNAKDVDNSNNVIARTSRKQRPNTSDNRKYNVCCHACGSFYKSESSYFYHLRYDCNQIHKCKGCERTFKNKRHLLDHKRDDCGRIHVCPNCGKNFKQKVNLTTHMKHYCVSKTLKGSP